MCQLEGLIFSLLHDREDQIAKMLYIYIFPRIRVRVSVGSSRMMMRVMFVHFCPYINNCHLAWQVYKQAELWLKI